MAGFLLRDAAYPNGGCEPLKSGKTITRTGDVITSWNGDGVFTGRELYTSNEKTTYGPSVPTKGVRYGCTANAATPRLP